MNPVKQIGRYQLPILNVASIQKRGRFRLRNPYSNYAVFLTNGHTIYFTEEEKRLYDQERETHETVMQVYGMAKGLGLRT
jgi:hypothetical protein